MTWQDILKEEEYKIMKAQVPTSYDEVIRRIDNELASGDSPIAEILKVVKEMAQARRNEQFDKETFRQMLEEAKRANNAMKWLGVEF